jgi:hypothetical protein
VRNDGADILRFASGVGGLTPAALGSFGPPHRDLVPSLSEVVG